MRSNIRWETRRWKVILGYLWIPAGSYGTGLAYEVLGGNVWSPFWVFFIIACNVVFAFLLFFIDW